MIYWERKKKNKRRRVKRGTRSRSANCYNLNQTQENTGAIRSQFDLVVFDH